MRVVLRNGKEIKCTTIKRSWGSKMMYYDGTEKSGYCSGEFDLVDLDRIEDQEVYRNE